MVINLKAPNGQILSLYKHNTNTDNGAASVPTAGFFNAVISSLGSVQFKTVPTPFQYGITAPAGPFQADALNGVTNPGYPVIMDPTGFVSNAANFNALTSIPNGSWTLAACDGGGGDNGTLVSWSINITYGVPSVGIWSLNSVGSGNYTGLYTDAAAGTAYTGTPLQTVYAKPTPAGVYNYYVTVSTGTCSSPGKLVPVTVNQPAAITAASPNVTLCTDKVATFSVTATGTALTYQWQVSTAGAGGPWNNISNGGVYTGATTSTLTITAPPVTMSSYQYRCIVQGAAPCASATSTARILTVNPLPVIALSASPYTSLLPGLTTTITSTVSPNAAATYTWYRNGAVVSGATTGILAGVDVDMLGDYTLGVTDVNGCTSTSGKLTIKDSVSGRCFIYPNPTDGKFQVRYYSVPGNSLPRGIVVYNTDGVRILTQDFTVSAPYQRMDVDMRANGKGLYWVEIVDRNGNRLSMCRVVVQ